ncbi:MAG TPA: GNAT family N-acetyltransferase [Rhodanobacteraceae bacterium]
MPQAFRIRRARTGDLDALVALEEATFDHDRVSPAQWRRHVRSQSACVLVAEGSDTVLGCVLVFFRRGSHCARLYSIAVAQRARGRGLGAALLKAAEREARARGCDVLRLEVRVDNAAAVSLYESHGYLRRERIECFYEDGTDAWCYHKALTPVTQ